MAICNLFSFLTIFDSNGGPRLEESSWTLSLQLGTSKYQLEAFSEAQGLMGG